MSVYEASVNKASKFLVDCKIKRFKKYANSLQRLRLKEMSEDTYDEDFFSTRFLVTTRCVNNGQAVIFDTHEPIESGGKMLARRTLEFGTDELDVRNLTVVDSILSTSAAPYFFKAHKVKNFYFHDGGVVANDPGLIALSFPIVVSERMLQASPYFRSSSCFALVAVKKKTT